jgi:hypothetical protein
VPDKPLQVIGWREWIALPELSGADEPLPVVKAKIDTGARTSALHAYYVEPFDRNGVPWVRFGLHPRQGDQDLEITCEAQIKDQRKVTDSGGHSELRYVIETTLALRDRIFTAEITLTDRENMRFRMLLGRTLLRGAFLVDSSRSFLLGGNSHQPPATLSSTGSL